MNIALVLTAIVAGALGAVLRYAVTRAVARRPRMHLPRAVLIVNVAGSLVAGAMLAFPGDLQYIIVAGLAGGLTTFSTFSVETVQLMLDGRSNAAFGNVVLNVAFGLIAAVAGYAAASGVAVALGLGV